MNRQTNTQKQRETRLRFAFTAFEQEAKDRGKGLTKGEFLSIFLSNELGSAELATEYLKVYIARGWTALVDGRFTIASVEAKRPKELQEEAQATLSSFTLSPPPLRPESGDTSDNGGNF